MTRRGSARIVGYAFLAATGLVAALALRRPELAIAAAPFAVLLAVGTGMAREPQLDAAVELDATRVVEGETFEAALRLASATGVPRLELLLELPDGVEVVDGDAARSLRLAPGEERTVPFVLRCARWGPYDVGRVELRAGDALRLVVWEGRTSGRVVVKAYPRPEPLERVLSAFETQAYAGNEVARVAGDGIEYADLRDFVPGDRVRSVNWRASARRGSLVVNVRHPERNTDVVLFLDSFVDLAVGDRGTLTAAVRAAAALADRYLRRRDRVGLVGYGGVLRWLRPGMGARQRYRLVETLLETGVDPTFTWPDVNLVPARVLPPKALVVALTPLVDTRFIAALEDLHARRFDLVVVELDPTGLVPHGTGRVDALAYRLWLLQREALRGRLERLGVGVGRWGDGESLDAALGEVRTYRRYARRARV